MCVGQVQWAKCSKGTTSEQRGAVTVLCVLDLQDGVRGVRVGDWNQ